MTIFVSHSQRDTEHLSFLNQAFSTTPNVDAKYEEIEAIDGDPRTADRIEKDIHAAECIFVILTENVAFLEHTRDWVAWECGVGSSKGVWVFEHPNVRPVIKIVIPKIDHYVAFRHTPAWVAYMRKQLAVLRKTRVPNSLPNLPGSWISNLVMKAAFPDEPVPELGTLLRRQWARSRRRDQQIKEFGQSGNIRCRPYRCSKCGGEYLIHREEICVIRCPICNNLESFSQWN